MAKQNGSLNKKFDEMISRLDTIIDALGTINQTLERHEKILLEHDNKFVKIEGTLKEIKIDLLEHAVHYGDRVLLQTDQGTTKAGILRQ